METTSLLLLCLLLLLLFLVYTKFFTRGKASGKLAPGPRGLTALKGLVGSMTDGDMVSLAESWHRQYGDLVLSRSILGDTVYINSARLLREVFAGKEHEKFTAGRPWMFMGWFVFYNFRNILSTSPHIHDDWAKMRKLFRQAITFYGDGMDRSESVMQAELQRLVSQQRSTSGSDVDVKEMISFSLNSMMIGVTVGEPAEIFQVELSRRLGYLADQLLNPPTDAALSACPWLRFVPGLPYRHICSSIIRARDDLMTEVFTRYKATHVFGQPRGLLDVYLDEQQKEGQDWLTDDHIRGLLMDTIAAGSFDPGEFLEAAILYLVHHPDVARKMQREIDDNLQQRPPRASDKSSLPYVEAAMLEIHRMTGVSMGVPHIATGDLNVEGYTIPKGAMLIANNLAIHRDPRVFPEPEVFRPERFLDDKGGVLPATHPMRQSVLPFSVGKRGCPGETFARPRLFLYLCTLLQRFHILPPAQHQLLPIQWNSWTSGATRVLKPFYVTFRPRD